VETCHHGPLAAYQRALDDGAAADPEQARAVGELQQRFEQLTRQPEGFLARWRGPEAVSGLYLWGGVGRGKTWLMDLFADSLPENIVWRVHFHRFMQRVHALLREQRRQRDPLDKVAAQLAKEIRVLCFDEFFVSDIADAMLLAGLLDGLLKRRVCLVATSNVPPQGLYKDGLQRAKFLPAIALLEKHCQVFELDSGQDYRLRVLQKAATWYPQEQAAEALPELFDRLAADHRVSRAPIVVNHRQITVVREIDDLVWFQFDALCRGHRSSADFIEIARLYPTVMLENVPQMDDSELDPLRRFIHFIDEMYDRHVRVILASCAPVTELYTGKRLAFEFERTESRLIEMQTEDYLALPHRP
jgi:cell division protein ZapE